MTPEATDLEPRCDLVTLSATDVSALQQHLYLGDDPYDPRQGLALASHAFLRRLQENRDELLDRSPALLAELMDSKDPNWWNRIRADWPPELQRPSWLLRVTYFGHSLALAVVIRRRGASARATYAVLSRELSPDLEAICCVYVQIDAEDEVGVLLDGWVDAQALFDKKNLSTPDEFVIIEDAALKPVHQLFALLHQPVPKAAPAPVLTALARPDSRYRLVYPAILGLSTLAAVVLGMFLYLRPERLIERTVEVHVPPRYAQAVVDVQFATKAQRGPGGNARVHHGQEFSLEVHAAAAHKVGWVFQVDSRAVFLVARLAAEPDGTLKGRHKDRFDDNLGWEYFVTVLADMDVAELGAKAGKVTWLNEAELRQLQNAKDDQEAITIIRQALDRAGLPRGYEVRIIRLDHQPN